MPSTRPSTARRRQVLLVGVVFFVAGIVALVLVVRAEYSRLGDPTPYQAMLDELETPITWELAYATIETPNEGCGLLMGGCPSATRFYVVKASVLDINEASKEFSMGAGYEVEDRWPDCKATLDEGSTCLVAATRPPVRSEAPQLWITIYAPGDDTEGLGISSPNGSVVRIIARPRPY